MESEVSPPGSREIVQAVLLDTEQRSRLLAYARSRFGIESDDAQDLLQETALELLRQRTAVRSPHGFTFKVFHLRCCRFIQARRTHTRVFVTAKEPLEAACDVTALETTHRRIELKELLETISSSCRKILLAYYVEGRSLQETAQAIPLPYSGVWTRINGCLRRLRACLET
ncbi:MAG TPA: sigma-70 family RNA polymerase sigma factor [Thermoanaerobaculia bacterium]|nr:sigma-70 family RNA polymerase sigma factor [Thermoanaerobaculia bacterium]